MGHDSTYKLEFKENIKNVLGHASVHVHTFWKGRVALYAILKAMNIQPGDEVLLPAFTCVVVPNPVLYLGGMPVYIDIDPHTYNMDVNKIESRITQKTKFIIAQNTFGLSSNLDGICEIARRNHLKLIEDCAHGFGGSYKGKPNGTMTEASFYSTQWNKPFSTGLGGFAVTSNQGLSEKLERMEEIFCLPGVTDRMNLKMLYLIRQYLLTPATYWPALKLYRWLSRHNLILGSSQGFELEQPVEPKHFAKGFSDFQAKIGINQLKSFEKTLKRRKQIAAEYDKLLVELDLEPPGVPSFAEHTYLKYPLLVKDRSAIFRDAENERIELGDWFLSPIHPVKKNYKNWHYRWGDNPIAEKISQHVINLPTHPDIDDRYMDRIQKFLKRVRNKIFRDAHQCLRYKGE